MNPSRVLKHKGDVVRIVLLITLGLDAGDFYGGHCTFHPAALS